MNGAGVELQEMLEFFAGSVTFWLVAAPVVVLALAALVRGGR